MLSRWRYCFAVVLGCFSLAFAEEPRPDLAVEVLTSGQAPVAGQPFSLTIRVANRGQAPAVNVVLTNSLDFNSMVISWPNGRFDRNLIWDKIDPSEVKEFQAEIIPFPPIVELQSSLAFQPGETVLFNNSFYLSEPVAPGQTTPPSIQITPPEIPPGGLRLGQFIRFSAEAGDSDGEVRRVRIYLKDTLLKEFLSPPFVVSTRLNVFGNVPLRVVADDNLGARAIATLDLEIRPPEIGELFLTESSIHRIELTAGAEPNRECHLFTSVDLHNWELFQKLSATETTVTFTVTKPVEPYRFFKVFHPKPPEGGGH